MVEFGLKLSSISFIHSKHNGKSLSIYHYYYYCVQGNLLVPVGVQKLLHPFTLFSTALE